MGTEMNETNSIEYPNNRADFPCQCPSYTVIVLGRNTKSMTDDVCGESDRSKSGPLNFASTESLMNHSGSHFHAQDQEKCLKVFPRGKLGFHIVKTFSEHDREYRISME